jgi:hypothetical protein
MAKTPVTQPEPQDHEFFESGNPSDINDPPSAGLLGTGYVGAAIPDARDHNWLFREHDRLKRFYIQRGLPNWSASETYQVGDIVRYSGMFLVCVVAPTVGLSPLTNFNLAGRYWEPVPVSQFGTNSAATDTTPIYRARNNQSYRGNGFDRLGFRDGPRVQNWDENWRGSEVLSATGVLEKTGIIWNTTVVGSGVGVSVDDPTGPLHSRSAKIQILTGGSDECRLLSDPLSMFDDNVDAVIEGTFRTGANVDLQRISLGMVNIGTEFYGSTNAFIGGVLYKGNVDANLMAVCGDGTTLGTPVDTGVAMSANTTYDYRIEWIGSSQAPDGGPTRCMNFYLNGNRVAQFTANLPNGGGSTSLSLVIAQKRDTGASARQISVLPMRFSARIY